MTDLKISLLDYRAHEAHRLVDLISIFGALSTFYSLEAMRAAADHLALISSDDEALNEFQRAAVTLLRRACGDDRAFIERQKAADAAKDAELEKEPQR